jgi:hypothetical protein
MFSEKLITLLQTLGKVERNRLRKYLLSPYLNDQPDLHELFDLCDKALRDNAVEKLTRQSVWQKLYPGKPLHDAQLRRMASDLTQLTLQFLCAEARIQSPITQALDLQRLLEKPELKKHLAGVERNILHLLETADGQSTEYYLAQFHLHNNISSRATKYLSLSGYAEKLSAADFNLSCFYLAQKLELYTGWLLYQGSRATLENVELPAGFWEYLENDRFINVPLLRVYKNVVECLTRPDDEALFRQLLDELEMQSPRLAKKDLRKCYFIAQNYCALKINQGKREYYREVFEIFKKITQKGVLLEDGILSEGIYKNIVTAGLGVGEFEWIESFIENYADYLPQGIRENARTFNLATLHFYQKKYRRVIELIRDVEYSDVVYALSAKQMLVRTYYELGEWLALDSLIDSFKIYLRRNKELSKNQKREYLNFLNFVKNLTILNPSDTRKTSQLKSRIETTSSLTPKKWLLEKINELPQKK